MAGISRYEKIALVFTAVFALFCVLFLVWSGRGGQPYSVRTAAPSQSQPIAGQEETGTPDSLLPGERIDLNTAPAKELQRLPGVGEKRAADIVAYREANGPFQSIEEITNVSGIGESTFAQLRDYITVNEE